MAALEIYRSRLVYPGYYEYLDVSTHDAFPGKRQATQAEASGIYW